MQNKPVRRLRLSISLRATLALFTLTIIVFGLLGQRIRGVEAIKTRVAHLGGHVWLESECDEDGKPLFARPEWDFWQAGSLSIRRALFPTIKCVDLRGTACLPSDLAMLSRHQGITRLYLDRVDINDEDISILERFVSLKYLSLDKTAVTSEDIAALTMAIPALEISADKQNVTNERIWGVLED